MPARDLASKIELDRQLNDPLIPGAVIFTEVRSQHRAAVGRPDVIRYRQIGEAAEDRIPRLTGSVHHIGGQIVTGELGVIQDIERFHAELQVTLSIAAQRQVLEDRKTLIVYSRIAQIEARIGSDLPDARDCEGSHVDGAAIPRTAIQQEARRLTGQICRRVCAQQPVPRVLARDAEDQRQKNHSVVHRKTF